MTHLVCLTEAVARDGKLVQRLLDANRLACSSCGERAAECVRGVYGDVALCAACDGGLSPGDLASNFGEHKGVQEVDA